MLQRKATMQIDAFIDLINDSTSSLDSDEQVEKSKKEILAILNVNIAQSKQQHLNQLDQGPKMSGVKVVNNQIPDK